MDNSGRRTDGRDDTPNERNGLFWLVSAARETEGQTDWIGLDWIGGAKLRMDHT